jgi:hypothetical protein
MILVEAAALIKYGTGIVEERFVQYTSARVIDHSCFGKHNLVSSL